MSSSSFSRPGAIDLSRSQGQGPAAASEPRTARAGRGLVRGRGHRGHFEAETIRKSVKHPVVLELYSPRVATGQQLSDALIEIANASDGKFLLARINVDTAPGIVQALQLQAVPTVIALIGGQAAPLFQGVLPKDQVQAAIDQLLKASVANGIVGRAEPVGGARPTMTPTPSPSRIRGSPPPTRPSAGATSTPRVAEFDKLLQANPGDTEAAIGKAQAGLLRPRLALDPQVVLLAASGAPDDVAVQLDAADAELITGQAEAGLRPADRRDQEAGRRRAQPGPAPAARTLRDPRQRRSPGPPGPARPDDRAVLIFGLAVRAGDAHSCSWSWCRRAGGRPPAGLG